MKTDNELIAEFMGIAYEKDHHDGDGYKEEVEYQINELIIHKERLESKNKELIEALRNLFKDTCYRTVTGDWRMWARNNESLSKECLAAKELLESLLNKE